MKNKRIAVSLLSAFVILSCSSLPKKGETPSESVENLLNWTIDHNEIEGISVAVVRSDKTEYLNAFGKATETKGFTTATLNDVASVSKIFTTLGIMKLHSEGLINLDNPVSLYVPDFNPASLPFDKEDVTIRSVLTHHSGIQSNYIKDVRETSACSTYTEYDLSYIVDIINDTALCYKPKTIHAYSNPGFTLLAYIIEQVSGIPFNDYMVREIFKPLGMNRTSFLKNSEYADDYAQSLIDKNWTDQELTWAIGAGALRTSADEMALFMSNVLKVYRGETIDFLRPDLLEEMWRIQNNDVPLDFDRRQMLGWYSISSVTHPERRYIGHAGDGATIHSSLLFNPEMDLAVFITVNNMGGNSRHLEQRALAIFAMYEEDETGTVLKPSPQSSTLPVIPMPEEVRQALVGNWIGSNGLQPIYEKGNGLEMDIGGNKFKILYHSDGNITIKYKLAGFIPINVMGFQFVDYILKGYEGKDYLQVNVLGQYNETMEKLEPVPVDSTWRKRFGLWVCENAESSDALAIDDFTLGIDESTGLFCASLSLWGMKINIPLGIRDDIRLYSRGLGRDMGDSFTYRNEDANEWIEYSGLRFVRFKK